MISQSILGEQTKSSEVESRNFKECFTDSFSVKNYKMKHSDLINTVYILLSVNKPNFNTSAFFALTLALTGLTRKVPYMTEWDHSCYLEILLKLILYFNVEPFLLMTNYIN